MKEDTKNISTPTPVDALDPMDSQDKKFNNPEEVNAKDRMLILTIVIIIVILGAMAIAGFLFIKQGPDTIQGQGEATEIRISGKLPGRVAAIYVEEGEKVMAGDTLVRINSTLADARLDQAQAISDAAAATSSGVDAGARPQMIESAKDVWQQAQAATGISRKTYERMQALFDKGVVSAQKRDEAKAAYDASVAGERAAKAQYDLAQAGARQQEKAASAAMARASKAGVKEVNSLLEDQYLLAPCSGEITVIYPNVSELVATGAPMMQLQLSDMHAVFNVRENLLKDIRVGTRLKVRIPALDKTTEMTVYYIRDLGTYANWQATKATGDYDARTFQIKARPDKEISGFRPGMSVIYEGIASQSKDSKKK